MHYFKLVLAITSLGILLGWVVGAALGRVVTEIYATLFDFPLLLFRPSPFVFALGAIVSLLVAFVGTVSAVKRAASLPPAEAMRPPEPVVYAKHAGLIERAVECLDQSTRIILRQVMRTPAKSFLTSLGVALAGGVYIMSLQWVDSIDHIVDVYFFEAQHQDLVVGSLELQPKRAIFDYQNLPGVFSAERMRAAGVKFRNGTRWHRGGIQGIEVNATLSPIHDVTSGVVPVPEDGLVFSTKLAEKLAVELGDQVFVEFLEGRRRKATLPVVAMFETYIGTPAYMNIDALNRVMRDEGGFQYVALSVDPQQGKLLQELKDLPNVSAVMDRRAAVNLFHATMAETMLIYVSFFAAFAAALACGVVYNSARLALSERGRDLATLRVLGFSQWEVSYILFGEVLLLVALALPLGCFVGIGLAKMMTKGFETELFRVPDVIEPSSYGASVVLVIIATLFSIVIVRGRVWRLDMISVLKTRE